MKNSLKTQEQVSIALCGLYAQYGYQPYKVNKFEEYELYMRNKNFLTSEQILTFTDTNGELMALKPDITLSIVKNTKDEDAPTKVCYAENAYRVPRGAYGFREIMQAGLECIGSVDIYTMGEVLMLAAKSLETISEGYALDISDMGIVSGILAEENLTPEQTAQVLSLIGTKNVHGLRTYLDGLEIDGRTKELLCALVTIYGPLDATLNKLEVIGLPDACAGAMSDLRGVSAMLAAYDVRNVNLDFSVVNDMSYYNGLCFVGFIDGIPSSVLSGGRYDQLMRRMGRRSEAIGFAVYLDQLERFMRGDADQGVDVLVIYDTDDQAAEAAKAAKSCVEAGQRVSVQRGEANAPKHEKEIRIGREAGK